MPTMASTAATEMNVALRTADSDVDGGCGPAGSKPSVIDLANSRSRSKFRSCRRVLKPILANFQEPAGLHLRHGYLPAHTGLGSPNREAVMAEKLSAEARKQALAALP